jgi:hypothetical protein
MAYKLEIRPPATIGVLEAYDWYEMQREGLELNFSTNQWWCIVYL